MGPDGEQSFQPPAALHGEDRLAAVAARDAGQLEGLKGIIPGFQDVAAGAEVRVQNAAQALDTARDASVSAINVRDAGDARWGGLGKLFGGADRARTAELAGLDVTDASRALNQAAGEKTKADTQLENTQRKVVHVDEVMEANKVAGPIPEVSSGMTEALKRQDAIQMLAEAGYPVENPKGIPPVETITGIRDSIRENRFGGEARQASKVLADLDKLQATPPAERPKHATDHWIAEQRRYNTEVVAGADKKAMEETLNIMPILEEITALCDREGIPLSGRLLETAVTEGLHIAEGVTGKDTSLVWEFARQKSGRDINFSDIGYYLIGAAQLDSFFQHRKNIQGRNRLPYVMAYAAGALESGRVQHMAHHLRDWLVETIPGEGIESQREGEQWVAKVTPPYSRGFGYRQKEYIDGRNFDLSAQTHDAGWVKIVEEANGMVLNFYDKLGQKGRYNAQTNFVSGAGLGFSGGRPDLKAPKYKEPSVPIVR